MTTQNLLVELFVEELPPKALKKLGGAFAGVLFEQLKARGLTSADSILTSYASPRRLAAHITQVPARGADEEVVEKLMPLAVAIKDGKPTEAFRKKLGKFGREHLADLWPNAVDGPDRLTVEGDGKADAVFLRGIAAGSLLLAGLEASLSEAIARLPIPKVMSYQLAEDCELPGWSSVNFVRPAHGLLALHGDAVVPVRALGLRAGRTTQGHRFEAALPSVEIAHADAYSATLARVGAVIASFDERRADIERQLADAAASVGGGCQPIRDDALLDEVTALVERPNVLICQFESQFLDVPQECLILTMKANQKYFPLLDASGKLTNQFLVVSNISPADTSAVVGGNERVVRPRLSDAKFFFDQDRKRTLASRVSGLDKVVYHNKLGTQGERSQRVRAIAGELARELHRAGVVAVASDRVAEAAMLAKTDLLTDMVGEFPELQGIMGRYYAINDGLSEDVADAIEDHYKPRFAGDELPRNTTGVIVALADKLETLVGMFSIGNLPTGDKDPFALRRHALGVVRMLVELQLPVDISAVVSLASNAFADVAEATRQSLCSFMYDRLSSLLKEQGSGGQEIESVMSQRPERLCDVPKRLQAVRAFAALPESPALAAANKRIGNILKKAGEVDAHVSPLLLQEAAEKALFADMQRVLPEAQTRFEAGDYTASLQSLAGLRASVDAFFDGVMVNAEQADLRLNRLGLLKSLHEAMNRVADLSRLAA